MATQEPQTLELTLRGFSPRELTARAEAQCASHFGGAEFQVEECRCVPCVCSVGGRVRLYEARVVAHAVANPA
jgi:hypothetical protein